MSKCIFENLTPKQAKTLANWFSGQGEQDCEVWFDEKGLPSPLSGKIEVIDVGHKTMLDQDDVIVYCN